LLVTLPVIRQASLGLGHALCIAYLGTDEQVLKIRIEIICPEHGIVGTSRARQVLNLLKMVSHLSHSTWYAYTLSVEYLL